MEAKAAIEQKSKADHLENLQVIDSIRTVAYTKIDLSAKDNRASVIMKRKITKRDSLSFLFLAFALGVSCFDFLNFPNREALKSQQKRNTIGSITNIISGEPRERIKGLSYISRLLCELFYALP